MSLLRLGFPTFVMCSNETHAAVRQRLETAGLEVDTVIEDVGEHIEETEEHARLKPKLPLRRKAPSFGGVRVCAGPQNLCHRRPQHHQQLSYDTQHCGLSAR